MQLRCLFNGGSDGFGSVERTSSAGRNFTGGLKKKIKVRDAHTTRKRQEAKYDREEAHIPDCKDGPFSKVFIRETGRLEGMRGPW